MGSRRGDKVAVANRFKAFRRKSLMSQAQLGFVIEICRQAVNRIENGRVMPHYSTLERFRNLEARHERARALSRGLAAESRTWRQDMRNITKGDTFDSNSQDFV